MKKRLFSAFLLACLGVLSAGAAQQLKVMQLNLWHGGSQVEGGLESIADQIAASDADFVTMCEVRNPDGKFISNLTQALRNRGCAYYGRADGSLAVLSRYPIDQTHRVNGGIFKLVTQVDHRRVVVYSAHLNYLYYACYYPRGYDGNSWKKMDAPITDVNKILENNRASGRPEMIRGFINDAQSEIALGALVFLGGDFNEPSHLDWQADTKNMWDHNGCVVPWDTSVLLYENGFKDSYRVKYRNAVNYPGFTFPAGNAAVKIEKLSWAPDADERDRIDFIYFHPAKGVRVKEAEVMGPRQSVAYNKFVDETGKDRFVLPAKKCWPTDHKGVLITFHVK